MVPDSENLMEILAGSDHNTVGDHLKIKTDEAFTCIMPSTTYTWKCVILTNKLKIYQTEVPTLKNKIK